MSAIEVCNISDVTPESGLIVERCIKSIMVYDKYNDTVNTKKRDGVVEFHYNSLDLFYWSEGKVQSCDFERYIRMVDLLRSKSYALPYMGIDLFESQIAIRKKR